MSKSKATSQCGGFTARWEDGTTARFVVGRNKATGQEVEMLPEFTTSQWERDGILPGLQVFADAAADRDWEEA